MSKLPAISEWPLRATSDHAQIESWWSRHPGANVAYLTGISGFDVLDVDVRPEGRGPETEQRLARMGLLDGSVAMAVTPSGGRHHYFPGTAQRKSNLGELQVDFQACGAFVLAPPSRVLLAPELVGYYAWRPHVGAGTGAPLDWARVRRAVSGRPKVVASPGLSGVRSISSWRRQVRSAKPGERNDRLFMVANRLVEKGVDPYVLVDDAIEAGLGVAEARSTVESAIHTPRRRRS